MKSSVAARRMVIAALGAACALGSGAGTAEAVDQYPCGKQVSVPWSPQPVQPCPLTSPTGPEAGVPVYATPVAGPPGGAAPPPAGWLRGTEGKYFACDKQVPTASFTHPSGWRNDWWAYTRSDDGQWGWVPEVYFKGGANDEPDYGLRSCPAPVPVSECQPTPRTTNVTIRARLRNGRRAITASYGRRLVAEGTVRDATGRPVPSTRLCVGVQGAGHKPVRQIGFVATDASGAFRYPLGPGVSRRVWFVHRTSGGAAAATIVVRVRAPIALRPSRRSLKNGQAVALRGRLRGGKRGLLVELQAARGARWQTFGTTRTRPGGRFRYRYRFTRTVGVQHYELRARIARQPGSRYATGASRPVRLRVIG